jgi:hypothetical protein
MKKLIAGLAGVCALALASSATAATITAGAIYDVPSNNNFESELNALGLVNFTSTGATITLDNSTTFLFEFLGSESGFNDAFHGGSVTGLEGGNTGTNTSFEDHFGSPIVLGTDTFAAGSLTGLLSFSSNLGIPATIGQMGFGIFLPDSIGPGGTYNTNVFYIGYNDDGDGIDDNHDDYIVRVTAVPEPGTWAMMLLGFGAMGVAVRRSRKSKAIAQLA